MDGFSRFSSKHSGFTLIELLIVVAIISILSAIAVPNFLEAQTRTKVSRTRAELKVIATGLETYRIDNSAYPWVGDPMSPSGAFYINYAERLKPVTSPVAYIQTIPRDIFAKSPDQEPTGSEYVYAPGNIVLGMGPQFNKRINRNTIYSLAGRGPDREIYSGGYCNNHPELILRGYPEKGAYDPTNGTVSQGDIIQLSCGRL